MEHFRKAEISQGSAVSTRSKGSLVANHYDCGQGAFTGIGGEKMELESQDLFLRVNGIVYASHEEAEIAQDGGD